MKIETIKGYLKTLWVLEATLEEKDFTFGEVKTYYNSNIGNAIIEMSGRMNDEAFDKIETLQKATTSMFVVNRLRIAVKNKRCTFQGMIKDVAVRNAKVEKAFDYLHSIFDRKLAKKTIIEETNKELTNICKYVNDDYEKTVLDVYAGKTMSTDYIETELDTDEILNKELGLAELKIDYWLGQKKELLEKRQVVRNKKLLAIVQKEKANGGLCDDTNKNPIPETIVVKIETMLKENKAFEVKTRARIPV